MGGRIASGAPAGGRVIDRRSRRSNDSGGIGRATHLQVPYKAYGSEVAGPLVSSGSADRTAGAKLAASQLQNEERNFMAGSPHQKGNGDKETGKSKKADEEIMHPSQAEGERGKGNSGDASAGGAADSGSAPDARPRPSQAEGER